jgi:zinc transport system ATP-binding protein
MNKAIEINNVTVRIDEQLILDEINISVYSNEFLGIIGPNGGGKTTLLKTILGLIKPESGFVKIFDDEPEKQRRNIGYVPQYNSFEKGYPITVEEVVKMGFVFDKHFDKKKLTEAMEKVDILNLRDKLIGNLSGGQKQRVLIARALVSDPKILLLDEPTASIDSKTGKSIYELLNKINESMTIILVSHDIGAISSYVKKIACLNKTLIYHDDKEITKEILEKTYECPVDLIAHGVPHRVFHKH